MGLQEDLRRTTLHVVFKGAQYVASAPPLCSSHRGHPHMPRTAEDRTFQTLK